MNEALREIALEAGAPVQVIDELWFNIFCIKFADAILALAKAEQ
jgi:hypothetical protein